MIIDTHAHIGTLPPFDMTIEQVLYSMDKYGIDFTILSNIEGAENDHQQNPVPPPYSKPQNQLLRETINAVRPYTDRLGIMPWLRIQHELPDEEFVSLIKENRDIIYGLKLHPFHSLTAPDEERLEPIYRLAAEFNLPIASHTGGCEQAMSPHLYNAAKRHPEVKFIMVHMDLGTDNSVALDLLGKLPNLYGDTTWVPVSTTVEAIRRYGSEKMLFGTDNPIDGKDTLLHNRTGDRSLYQQYFNELRELISVDDYENLMYKNAQRMFGLHLVDQSIILLQFGTYKLTLYRLMRDLGRFAFPIFCFLLIEGFLHTRSKVRYGISLAVLAVISEIPFDLEHNGTFFYSEQNVFFTLLLGYLGLCAIARFREKPLFAFLSLLGLLVVCYYLNADYWVQGFAFIILLYALREQKLLRIFTAFLLNNFRFVLLAFLPIALYNGKRGFIRGAFLKYLFYLIYPLHIFIIYLIKLNFIGFE